MVLERAVDHVGDGLEPAVGVPGRALGLAGGVLDLAHLIHVDEGVQLGVRQPGERASHREALALETRGRSGDRSDGALHRVAEIGLGDCREREGVFHGDGRHDSSNNLRTQVFP
jgi:hypothetical protein